MAFYLVNIPGLSIWIYYLGKGNWQIEGEEKEE